jgi:hypothetical protein
MEENKNINEPQVKENTAGEAGTDKNGQEQEQPVTIESLMADMAKLRAENAKIKLDRDKALHNNGELTKQLRAKMTASEQEEAAKKEREEAQQKEIDDLKNYKRRSEARERYLTLGMSPEHAKQAAEAEVAGDMEALANVQKLHTDTLLKTKEAEWLKSRPDVNSGHDEDKAAKDPFLAGWESATL